MKVFNRAAAQVEYAANIQAWPDAANPPQLNHPCAVYDLRIRSGGFMMLAAIRYGPSRVRRVAAEEKPTKQTASYRFRQPPLWTP